MANNKTENKTLTGDLGPDPLEVEKANKLAEYRKQFGLPVPTTEASSPLNISEGEWEVLEEDAGEVVEFDEAHPAFAGRLVMVKSLEIDQYDGQGPRPTNLYSFEEATTGERCSVWGTYQIDKALKGEDTPYKGRFVYIEWQGKSETGKGGRTINRFFIAVK